MPSVPIERNFGNLILEGAAATGASSSSSAQPQKEIVDLTLAEETAASETEVCVWTEHNNCEEALGLIFEYIFYLFI